MNQHFTNCMLLTFCLLSAQIVGSEQKKDDILDQKKQLQNIQKEVEQGKQALDSLKSEELRTQKKVSEYDQKITSNRKLIDRLSGELGQIRRDIRKSEEQLTVNQQRHKDARQRFLDNLRRFYLATRKPLVALFDQPNQELEINREVVYLSVLAGYESSNVDKTSMFISESVDRLGQLTGEKKKVTSLKKQKETATALDKSKKEQQQQQLQLQRRRKSEEIDRIIMLEQAAQEMETIVARLEHERLQRLEERRQGGSVESSSVFSTLKGQLLPPYRGEIVVPFGASIDPINKLRSFSPGITIKGKAGREVVAAASGSVVYIGDLRGYSRFVIIDHGDQFYSTYAGLDEILVTRNQYLLAGSKLALSGDNGLVKFELRRGRESLDPVKWIKIDSY